MPTAQATRRRFHLVDAMLLLAATAVGVSPAPMSLRRFPETLRGLRYAAEGTDLRYNSIDQLVRDPRLNWVLYPGLQIGALPGRATLGWALFDSNGPQLARQLAMYVCIALWPLLVCWGGALLALRLFRQPRPPLRELARQPGVWLGFAPFAALGYLWNALESKSPPIHAAAFPIGIALVWVVFTAFRIFIAEPSWIDRAGRAMGAAWIVTMAVSLWAR